MAAIVALNNMLLENDSKYFYVIILLKIQWHVKFLFTNLCELSIFIKS